MLRFEYVPLLPVLYEDTKFTVAELPLSKLQVAVMLLVVTLGEALRGS